jgi:hypothetical protein
MNELDLRTGNCDDRCRFQIKQLTAMIAELSVGSPVLTSPELPG